MRAAGKRPYPAMQPAGQRTTYAWNVLSPSQRLPALACTPAASYNTAAAAARPAHTGGERMTDTAASGWYYALHGERVGPRSLEEVRSLVANGVLDADSLVWTDGMREWARVGDFSILSPDYVQPASAPAPRAEAEWAPAEAPAPRLDSSDAPRPWVRFGARLTDLLVSLFVMAGIASSIPALAARMPTDPAAIRASDQFLMTAILGVLVVLLEGFLLHLFGTTPGKSLFVVRVTTAEGGRLSLVQSLSRAFRAWVLGMGAGLPILTILVPIASYFRLASRGRTVWDEAMDLRVEHGEISAGRALAIAGFLLMMLLMIGSALSGMAGVR